MLIDTTRFGKVDIDDRRVITFMDGPLGFTEYRKYALIQTIENNVFSWLQSLENPSLAFLVCDPLSYVPDYQAQIRPDDVKTLELKGLTDCQVLVIVNKSEGYLTANLLGPLVIGMHSLLAKQLVLSDKRYGTRHKLVRIGSVTTVSKTA